MTAEEKAAALAIQDRLVSEVLGGRQLVQGASSQLARLWQDDFQVVTDSTGRPVLQAKSGKPVAEEVAARLGGETSQPPGASSPPGSARSG